MDENFFSGIWRGIQLGWRLGRLIARGILWLTDWPKIKNPYNKLLNEQRNADQYGETGRKGPHRQVKARVMRRGGDR